MKKIILPIIIMLSSVAAMAQMTEKQIPYIEVTGSAEMEIDPDEIRMEVTIADFTYDKVSVKNGKETTTPMTVSIANAENALMSILKKEGIGKEQTLLKTSSKGGYYYNWGSWRYQYNNCVVKMEKKYEIIFKSYDQLNNVLQALPSGDEGIVSVDITSLKNKNEEQFRKQVKINAMKAAKDKAQYLLESIGSMVGKPIYVIEVNNDYAVPMYRAAAMSNMKMIADGGGNSEPTSQMQKIKLRYEIRAQFEIK